MAFESHTALRCTLLTLACMSPLSQGLEWSNRALKQGMCRSDRYADSLHLVLSSHVLALFYLTDKDGDQAHEFLGPF